MHNALAHAHVCCFKLNKNQTKATIKLRKIYGIATTTKDE